MASLNQISQSYISGIGKDYDYALNERIKFIIKGIRAELIRQEFERNPADQTLRQSFVVSLESTDDAISCLVQSGCSVKKTTTKIPKPVNIKSPDSFAYVGPAKVWMQEDILPYKQVSGFGKMIGQTHTRYTKEQYLFEYVNGYGYTNNCLTKYMLVSGYFENPEEAVDLCVNSANCVTDDDDFPVGQHMLNRILGMIAQREARMILPNTEVEQEIKPLS